MSNLFADYQPRGSETHQELAASVAIRPAIDADVAALARISHQRNGGELVAHLVGFEQQLRRATETGNYLVLTALLDDRPVAFGKAGVFTPPGDAPANCAPAGWYLFGVVVAPEARRHGIGLELTRQRLAHIEKSGEDVVYYFASALNRATIDLHAQLGFEELTRDFWFSGTTFTGGVGILFHART